MRPLGSVQAHVLSCLRENGRFIVNGFGSGWVWDTYSNTIRVLDTLVKRGLVTKGTEEGPAHQGLYKTERIVYRPVLTQAAQAEYEAGRARLKAKRQGGR